MQALPMMELPRKQSDASSLQRKPHCSGNGFVGMQILHYAAAKEKARLPKRINANLPQGLKPRFYAGLGGTAEAVPFPK
jgi:hypothetical protein